MLSYFKYFSTDLAAINNPQIKTSKLYLFYENLQKYTTDPFLKLGKFWLEGLKSMGAIYMDSSFKL